jgi:hypothetical protein
LLTEPGKRNKIISIIQYFLNGVNKTALGRTRVNLMMSFNLAHLLEIEANRRSNYLRDAENARMATDARASQPKFTPHRPLLSWTGRRLVALGYRLLDLSQECPGANPVYNGVKS